MTFLKIVRQKRLKIVFFSGGADNDLAHFHGVSVISFFKTTSRFENCRRDKEEANVSQKNIRMGKVFIQF